MGEFSVGWRLRRAGRGGLVLAGPARVCRREMDWRMGGRDGSVANPTLD